MKMIYGKTVSDQKDTVVNAFPNVRWALACFCVREKSEFNAMLRYQVFLSYGTMLLASWWWCMTHQEQIVSTKLTHRVVVFAPLFGAVSLGVYLLARLTIGVASYQDCSEAAAELDSQIKEAKAELRKRKIIVD
jgi:dolichol-phosphate mannosyltransferase subunit 3